MPVHDEEFILTMCRLKSVFFRFVCLCYGLVVSDWLERFLWDACSWWGDYFNDVQFEECIFFVLFVYVIMCFLLWPYTIYILYPMAWYSLFVLEVPLNTNELFKVLDFSHMPFRCH